MDATSASPHATLADPFFVGEWRVDVSANELSRQGETVKLEPRAMEVLRCLAEHAGDTVTRERLDSLVWKQRIVGYDSLNVTVSKLRRALDDNPRNPRFIQTVPKVGYRLVGQVGASPSYRESSDKAPKTSLDATPNTVAGRFWRALGTPGVAVAVLAPLVVAVAWNWNPIRTDDRSKLAVSKPLSASSRPSIAILPFDNLSGDPEQEYFSDGITDDLITDLSKVSGLRVIARSSVFPYKGKSIDITEVAQRLDVRYVLAGSVRRAHERVRINAQLVNAHSGEQLWADRYDGPLADIFTLQDDVSARIVSALKVHLTPEEKRMAEIRGTRDIDAFDAFLRGLALLTRKTPEDAAAAVPFFETALKRDSDYGRAYAALARSHWTYAVNERFNTITSPMAGPWSTGRYSNYMAAWKLLHQARTRPSAEAYALSARMLQRQRRYAEAMRDARQAVDLAPSAPAAAEALIEILIYAGKAEAALERIDDSIGLDPSQPGEKLFLSGLAHYSLGHFEEAIRTIRRARIHNPEQKRYEAILAAALAAANRYEEAETALEEYLSSREALWDLNAIMLEWPFSSPSAARRLAANLRQAGLPGATGDYFAVAASQRLSSKEIKTLLSSKAMVGIVRGASEDVMFEVVWDEDTQIVEQGFVNFFRADGKSRAADDLLCAPWHDWGNYCVAIFRNPNGAREYLDEYVFFTLTGIFTFSVFDPSTRTAHSSTESDVGPGHFDTAITANRLAVPRVAPD
jgi:adenylate cyclase